MGAGGQHQRSGHPEVGKQQLAEIPEHRLFLPVVYRHCHVPQAQALHSRTVLARAHQRHQRAPQRHNGVSQRLRYAVAIPRGPGAGIGHPACGQDDRLRGVRPLLSGHGAYRAIRRLHRCGPVTDPPHLPALQLPFQRVGDVEGTVRHRKHPVSPFHLQRHAQRLEKRHGVPRREPCQRTVQKSPITGNAGKQRLPVTVIGHIAPALAGDIHLLAQPFVGLQQRHRRALPGRGDGRHQTGGAAADHHDLLRHVTRHLSRKYCT